MRRDSIQIRIWYGCPVGFGEFLIILRNNTKKWEAEVAKITAPQPGKIEVILLQELLLETHRNRVGVKFINRFFDLSVLALPDEKQLKNLHYDIPMDGCWVEVEIATKNSYRQYGYGNPEIYAAEFLEARNIISILKLINEEFRIREKFNVKFMWPDDDKNVYRKDSVDSPPVPKEIQLQEIEEDSTKLRH